MNSILIDVIDIDNRQVYFNPGYICSIKFINTNYYRISLLNNDKIDITEDVLKLIVQPQQMEDINNNSNIKEL